MSNNKLAVKKYLEGDVVQGRIRELLKDKASQFIISVTALTNDNPQLAECTPNSLVGACLTATAMDLPVNQNLGFVYIIPYKDKKTGVTSAQLQFGYRAFIQLAMRSGQFKTISATPIYEGQIESDNPLEGYQFDFKNKESDKIVGYASYFKLLNGFEKVLYMTKEELKDHGKKYSQTFKKGYGMWEDEFDSMARKTVLKLLLSKYAPLSIEMQQAVITDQATYDMDGNLIYPDNKIPSLEEVMQDKEASRLKGWIEGSETLEKLQEANDGVYESENQELIELYEERVKKLGGKVKK